MTATTEPVAKAGPAATGTLYVLKDPRDNRVRYVGATTVPLDVRLRGHLSKSTNTFVQAWIAELKAAGLQPIIYPLRRNVPIAELGAAESAEIHRRAMRREPLLNIIGTERAARHFAEQAVEKARARELADWRRTAAHLLKVTGGPIPPGFTTPRILSDETWAAIEQGHLLERRVDAAGNEEAAGRRPNGSDDTASLSADLALVAYDISERADQMICEDTWRSIRSRREAPVWRDAVDTCVKMATNYRRGFADRDETDRHLSLLRWYLTVIPPWRALAYRCDVPSTGPEFHAWVTSDPEVREALRIVEKGEPFTERAVSATFMNATDIPISIFSARCGQLSRSTVVETLIPILWSPSSATSRATGTSIRAWPRSTWPSPLTHSMPSMVPTTPPASTTTSPCPPALSAGSSDALTNCSTRQPCVDWSSGSTQRCRRPSCPTSQTTRTPPVRESAP
ncbi:hypothetical protein ACQPZJ_44435 [Actinoplanes sp. CA-054009]